MCVLKGQSEKGKKVSKTLFFESLLPKKNLHSNMKKEQPTIADLEGVENINGDHISEAIQYRSLDRDGWLG